MCADCWGVKDRVRAKRWLRDRPRTSGLSAFDRPFGPENLLWALGLVVFLVLAVVWGLSEWI